MTGATWLVPGFHNVIGGRCIGLIHISPFVSVGKADKKLQVVSFSVRRASLMMSCV